MEKVSGIGGVFFRSQNPAKLAEWYEKHLGINQVPDSYDKDPWVQLAGPTVFTPFDKQTDYFGRDSQQWMLNFRVDNLSSMITQLEAEGIEVTLDQEDYPNGKFARIHDPEGNPIELWQPEK